MVLQLRFKSTLRSRVLLDKWGAHLKSHNNSRSYTVLATWSLLNVLVFIKRFGLFKFLSLSI